jgi:hypothetical protein
MITHMILVGPGKRETASLPANAFGPILVEQNSRLEFNITLTEDEMRYTSGKFFREGASNTDMIVRKGIGRNYPFGYSFLDRVWNGEFKYALA